jgi:uncharacterized protein YqjF (DUF2071 family)
MNCQLLNINVYLQVIMRPKQPPFLTATWRHLVMLSYEADPQALQKYVPVGTELDFWNGKCLISIVGLLFLNTRVLGVPVPFYRNYEQVNLRFYVRRQSSEGWKRGTVFIKQIVPKRAIALVAQRMHQEKFVAMPMNHTFETLHRPGQLRRVSYQWFHRGERNKLSAQASGEPTLPPPGSSEEFVAEHYWGYNRRHDGATLEYQVERSPWRLWKAEQSELACGVAGIYGPEFEESLKGPPVSAFLAEGSDVVVYRGSII